MAAFQLLAYAMLSKSRYGKLIVLGILIFANLFVLPTFFRPDYPEGQPRCGLPDMAISIGFWFIGNGIVLMTHLCFWLYERWSKGSKQ